MPKTALILAVDIGTSATKSIIYDQNLQVVSLARRLYPILTPNPGWSEQEPDVIAQAVVQAIRESVESLPADRTILAVTFSSQQYSILAVDPKGVPLTRSLTWSDTRSAAIAGRFRGLPQAREVYEKTACPIDAIYPLSKIGWLQANNRFEGGTRFVSIKEYILYQLTGRWIADWSTASASGLFDIRLHRWDPTALRLLKITTGNLSELCSPRTLLNEWRADFITATGLPANTPLVVGGGDGPMANVGVGAITPEILAINVGTSAAARCAVRSARVDPEGRLWTYVADEELWTVGGIVSSGGLVYRWWVENNTPGIPGSENQQPLPEQMQAADQAAGDVPPGAEGLLFIPYLGGEQCPTWYPHTRACFAGLDFHHQRGHMARAVLEGITRSLYRVAEQIHRSFNQSFSEIRVTGGLTWSGVWLQIAADMFGIPVVVPKSTDGSACGAAVLAGLALGLWSGLEEASSLIEMQTRIEPRPEIHEFYESQYALFLEGLRLSREFSNKMEDKP